MMADRPIFVAAYRQVDVAFRASVHVNTPMLAFTPGPNGSRLHAIAVANDHTQAMLVEFGKAELVSQGVQVNLVPGANAATDPFTLNRLDGGDWTADGWVSREVVTFNQKMFLVGNRGDFRIEAITPDTLTFANSGITPVQQLGITVDLWRWVPMWSVEVPARAGMDGNPAHSALDLEQMPWLDPAGDRWLVLTNPLWVRVPANVDGSQGNLFLSFMGGDY